MQSWQSTTPIWPLNKYVVVIWKCQNENTLSKWFSLEYFSLEGRIFRVRERTSFCSKQQSVSSIGSNPSLPLLLSSSVIWLRSTCVALEIKYVCLSHFATLTCFFDTLSRRSIEVKMDRGSYTTERLPRYLQRAAAARDAEEQQARRVVAYAHLQSVNHQFFIISSPTNDKNSALSHQGVLFTQRVPFVLIGMSPGGYDYNKFSSLQSIARV